MNTAFPNLELTYKEFNVLLFVFIHSEITFLIFFLVVNIPITISNSNGKKVSIANLKKNIMLLYFRTNY